MKDTHDNRSVYKRQKPLIPQTHFLTALGGEAFYNQQLLLKVPFRDDMLLLCPENVTKTFKEECYIQGLFDTVDGLDISFQEMKQRNFDPVAIFHIACKMLIQEMVPLGSLKKKI